MHVQKQLLRTRVGEFLAPEHRAVRPGRDGPRELLAEEQKVIVTHGCTHRGNRGGESRGRSFDVIGLVTRALHLRPVDLCHPNRHLRPRLYPTHQRAERVCDELVERVFDRVGIDSGFEVIIR